MTSLLTSVFWRYAAIATQFLIVTLVAQRAPIDVAGSYFAFFGFVAVAFTVVGLGAPDGLVRLLPPLVRDANRAIVRTYVLANGLGSLITSILFAGLGAVLGIVLLHNTISAVLLMSWWLGYALVFALAQTTLAMGKPSQGAFQAYTSINLAYILVQIPYLVFASEVSLHGLLTAAVASTYLALGLNLLATYRILQRPSLTTTPANGSVTLEQNYSRQERFFELIAVGFPMMSSRLLQASLPWIPVWVLQLSSDSHGAAVYATAGRFVVAVTSVVAALRFSIRPQLVLLYADGDFDKLTRIARQCCGLAAAPPIIAIGVLLVAGKTMMAFILGSKYDSASLVLLVLMLGVLAEAFGGVSDEILKMMGKSKVVVVSLIAAVSFQALLSPLAAAVGGLGLMAAVTAGAFALQYLLQVMWLARHSPIKIWSTNSSWLPLIGRGTQ